MSEYPHLRLRVVLSADTFIGPGKADLLQGIDDAGSIAAAGRRMGMSYKRAWMLMETMNAYFGEPLAIASKGGKAGGGALLTPKGKQVLACFRRIEARTARAAAKDLAQLSALRGPGAIDAA